MADAAPAPVGDAAPAQTPQPTPQPAPEGAEVPAAANAVAAKPDAERPAPAPESAVAATTSTVSPAAPAVATPATTTAPAFASPTRLRRIVSGATEYVLSRVSDREGEFWTPVGSHNGDPEYSFAEAAGADGRPIYVHLATKGRVDQLPDWVAIAEPEPLAACITVFGSGTVTAYRLCEVSLPAAAAAAAASPKASDAGAAARPAETERIAVYAPTQMTPNPPEAHCWAPKLDRLKGKYFFVNCETRAKVWWLPEVIDAPTRVRAIFRRYDPAREADVPALLKANEGRTDEYIASLVRRYGPEPAIIENRTRERLTALLARYDRARLDDCESLLAANVGREDELIQGLLRRYRAPQEPPTFRQRIAALYEKYAPDRLDKIDETVVAYSGKELQLIYILVRRLGPEPLEPCKPNKTADETLALRRRALRVYQKYCPARLPVLAEKLKESRGIEELMLEVLVFRYGPEPSADELLPPVDDAVLRQLGLLPGSSLDSVGVGGVGADGLPLPQGGAPVQVVPLDHASALSPELAARQQQSAIALLSDMEERLRSAYARLEEAHQRAELLRGENVRLHEYSNRVMQDNDVITQEIRAQLAGARQAADETRQRCAAERDHLVREHAAATAAATHKLQEELLAAERTKLEQQRTLSELHARLCAAEEGRGETTVQTQYLRQRCAGLEQEIEQARRAMDDLKTRLRERDDVSHRGVQTGGDDQELRAELRQRRLSAQRELEALGAEAQRWRSLATRLESELRAAERRRDDAERASADELARAGTALGQARDLNLALEDRVACLEAELLATPAAALGATAGEHALREKVGELQRELADAQATIRGQRKQLTDLRGLLAMHMAQAPISKVTALAASPSAAAAASSFVQSPSPNRHQNVAYLGVGAAGAGGVRSPLAGSARRV